MFCYQECVGVYMYPPILTGLKQQLMKPTWDKHNSAIIFVEHWHITLELSITTLTSPQQAWKQYVKEHSVIIKPSKQLHDNPYPYEDILLKWILKSNPIAASRMVQPCCKNTTLVHCLQHSHPIVYMAIQEAILLEFINKKTTSSIWIDATVGDY